MALRVAAAAVSFALGGASFGIPLADARAASAQVTVQEVPAWGDVAQKARDGAAVAAELDRARAADAEAMRWGKLQLALLARDAGAAYEASDGKASDAARMALAVERNRALTAVDLGDTVAELQAVLDSLTPAIAAANAEVAAWEAAEAARKAEEARRAAEAAAAAARAAAPRASASSSGAGASPSGSPQDYLNGIAAGYGLSIGWGATACGHGTATSVAGCYMGGGTIYVNNAAFQSWDVARGRGRNVVLHEVSHARILQICGTVYVSDRFENVTDAYAILLGAGGTTGYGYSDADMQLARNIKNNGQCWS